MSVCFVIPAYGRLAVSAVSFAGIAWTCSELASRGVEAGALIVADDENLDLASEHGFETLNRPNQPLGRKWNDGYQAALDLEADYVVSCGSDDWVHPDLIAEQLELDRILPGTILCSRTSAVIAPDGSEAVTIRIGYPSGDGVRTISRAVLDKLGGSPYDDKRGRALDGSMADRCNSLSIGFSYVDLHPWQIVDFKSADSLTAYEKFPGCEHEPKIVANPFELLVEHYPAELIETAAKLYEAKST